MRKLLLSTLTAGCLLGAAATPAQAVSTPALTRSITQTHTTALAPAQQGPATVSARHIEVTDAHLATKNKTKKKRSGLSRLFGTLAFLFIGLPLLLVLAAVVFFMLRRARKRNEQTVHDNVPVHGQYGTPTQNGQGQPPYPGERH